MYYTTDVSNSSELLDQAYEALLKFDKNPFLAAMEYKRFTEIEIIKLTHLVSTHRNNLEHELKSLCLFAREFNNEFVTADNSRFDAAAASLRKIRSSMSCVKKIWLKFCPRARKETIFHKIGNNPVSAFQYSYISRDSYQLSFLNFEGYPPCVSELFNEMEGFFLLMMRAIQLCKQVIRDEQRIRRDKTHCYFLFIRFKEKILQEIGTLINWISPEASCFSGENNPAIASRIQYACDQAWASVGFHNYTPEQVKYLILKEEIDKEEGKDIPLAVRQLFGFDTEEARKGLLIIRNFNSLITGKPRENKLPGKLVKFYFGYFGLPKGKMSRKQAVNIFNDTYTKLNDKHYLPANYDAVSNSKDLSLNENNEMLKRFNDILLFGQNNKKASNF